MLCNLVTRGVQGGRDRKENLRIVWELRLQRLPVARGLSKHTLWWRWTLNYWICCWGQSPNAKVVVIPEPEQQCGQNMTKRGRKDYGDFQATGQPPSSSTFDGPWWHCQSVTNSFWHTLTLGFNPHHGAITTLRFFPPCFILKDTVGFGLVFKKNEKK